MSHPRCNSVCHSFQVEASSGAFFFFFFFGWSLVQFTCKRLNACKHYLPRLLGGGWAGAGGSGTLRGKAPRRR